MAGNLVKVRKAVELTSAGRVALLSPSSSTLRLRSPSCPDISSVTHGGQQSWRWDLSKLISSYNAVLDWIHSIWSVHDNNVFQHQQLVQ